MLSAHYSVSRQSTTPFKCSLSGRIGVKPIQSNALLMAQKKNGQAAEINDASLRHFSSPAPGKQSPKVVAVDDGADDDDDSGDEAEKLDEKQMGEIDSIYRK